ncbi:MAG: hypothetical protein SFY56_11485 [Bacteroidota bacterium]|nr:hypothetical protein [Bacteroidota bacterium]
MNKVPIYLFSVIILISCSENNAIETEHNLELTSIDSVSNLMQNSVSNTKFPEADSLIYSFFSGLNALEKFVDPAIGVYCIESGPGATPLLEKLKSKEDVLGKTPFLFMSRDYAFIKNYVKTNPVNFDVCANEEEGYFIFDCDTSQNILQNIYQINQTQGNNIVDTKMLNSLKQIDGSLYRSVLVCFREKHGDFISLRLYFTKENNRIYLSILDLSDCSV